ncbi:MAG: ERCC4 domain-containing protein [Syntrophobacteraceae bacterium]
MPIIKIDSREQLAYEFHTPTEVGKLDTGDYSLVGAEHLVSIERKSVDDLVQALTTGRERFERELHRGRALDYFALVIEASLSDLASGRYRSQANPKAMIQSLMAFSVRFDLPIFFAENRKFGTRITESLLLKYAVEQEKRYKAAFQGVSEHRPEGDRGI